MQRDIDFDRELRIGRKAYNKKVGLWWRELACDGPHAYAYKNIANEIASLKQRKSPVIVDYACGTGSLLSRLVKSYPGSEFYGIDGSSLMLDSAKKRLRRLGLRSMERVKLVQAHLPDFSMLKGIADMVVYAFPHVVPETDEELLYENRYPKESELAWFLIKEKEKSGQYEAPDGYEIQYQALFMERMISRNLHGLLRKGGLCIRVEYAEAENGEDPTHLDEMLSGFQEVSFDQLINGKKTKQLFKALTTTYFRSKVIRDVYHQTGEDIHQEGGYYISVLRAV